MFAFSRRACFQLTFAISATAALAVWPMGDAAAKPALSYRAPVAAHVSPALDSLPEFDGSASAASIHHRRVPPGARVEVRPDGPPSTGQALTRDSRRPAPPVMLGVAGLGNGCGCSPPDTSGDVGLNDYVQVVNATSVAVFKKNGTMRAGYPKQLKGLWSGTPGNCDNSNDGDPTVIFDTMANRWVLSQFFETGGNGVCVAVSQTSNPGGAYNLYEFSTGMEFPDYFKIGAWPNAYYMGANEATYAAYALDRASMLAGSPAGLIRFGGQTNFLMPADVDGAAGPGATDPGLFYTFKDGATHGGSDRIELFAFHPDFATPANSTFALSHSFPIDPFTYTACGAFNFNCIRQKGTSQKLDAVSEWPMMRFGFRSFTDHDSLFGNFTVQSSVPNAAAIRWFELQDSGSGWGLHQEGTIDSNDGVSRFMGSIAMDGFGSMAIGYSKSSSTMFPSIAIRTRNIFDPLGTMSGERTVKAGGGAQTGSNRWGDYSAMAIDPADDITFWYTNEYYAKTSGQNWKTFITAFRETQRIILRSIGGNDGTIAESSENSGSGGGVDAASSTCRLGDDGSNRQFRCLFDFDTSPIPDNAKVLKAILRIKRCGASQGTNPFAALGPLWIDIRKGFFGSSPSLQKGDFQAPGGVFGGQFDPAPVNGWYSGIFLGPALPQFNNTGHTQIRLLHALDDNNNHSPDFQSYCTGDSPKTTRAQLAAFIVRAFLP